MVAVVILVVQMEKLRLKVTPGSSKAVIQVTGSEVTELNCLPRAIFPLGSALDPTPQPPRAWQEAGQGSQAAGAMGGAHRLLPP